MKQTILSLTRFILASFWLFFMTAAHADVIWEDYQGSARITGTSGQDLPGPSYDNSASGSAERLAGLRAISANPANAVRTGTSTQINYRAADNILCNLDADPAGTGPACQADAQGRVLYAVLKLPFRGDYTFQLAHDDDIDLDLSSTYGASDYRGASYNIPISAGSQYTTNDLSFEPLAGTVNASADNACVLLRLYWNNVGSTNHLRLQWTRPSSSGSIFDTTEIVPASALMTPGTTSGCTGAGAPDSTWSLTVDKVIATTGRASPDDQFTVSIHSGSTLLAAATTGGSGSGSQASTGATFLSLNSLYRITDNMAAGSHYTLQAYTSSISCTMDGQPFTPTYVSPGVWHIATPLITLTDQIYLCAITNTRASRQLQLRKTWVEAVPGHAVTIPPTSGFSSNTSAFASVADTANESDNGTTITVLTGTGTLAAESFTNGNAAQYGSVLSCSDGTLSGTNAQSANQLSIGAPGATIVCVYTNSYRPPLSLAKISVPYWDPANGTTDPKLIPGALVDYIISVASPTTYATGPNSVIVFDSLPDEVALYVNDIGAAPPGPLVFTTGTSGLTYDYGGLTSLTDDIDFSADDGASWSYIPHPDADGVDAAITSIRVNPKGSMAAGSNFQIRIRAKIK